MLCWQYLAVDGVFDADRHPVEQPQLLWLCFPQLDLTLLQILCDAVCFYGDLESLEESRQRLQVRHILALCITVFSFTSASSPSFTSPSVQLILGQLFLFLSKTFS